ncbi:uncharacterized protein ISCGN_011699 [Ixodes scapularis]
MLGAKPSPELPSSGPPFGSSGDCPSVKPEDAARTSSNASTSHGQPEAMDTRNATSTDPAQGPGCPDSTPYCQGCRKKGHLGTDRKCPTWQETNKRMREDVKKFREQHKQQQQQQQQETATGAVKTPVPPSGTSWADRVKHGIVAPPPSPSSQAEIQELRNTCNYFKAELDRLKAIVQAQQEENNHHKSTLRAEELLGEMQIFRLNLVNNHGTKTRLGDARQKDTTPDLTWTSNIYTYHHKWKCLPDSWGSDHFPIFFEFSPTKKIKDKSKRRVAKTIHWDKFRATLEEDLAEITDNKPSARKGDTKQLTRKAKAHTKMVEAWDPSCIMAAYTDTASLDGPVTLKTAAAAIPALQISATKQLPEGASTKGGELTAIRLALETVLALPDPLTTNLRIFTDSQEAVKECRIRNSPSRIVRSIKKLASQLASRGTSTRIAWVPGHAGIPGNEQVHRLARASLILPRGSDDIPASQHDHGYGHARDRAQANWEPQEYDPGEVRAKIREDYLAKLEEKLPENPDPLPCTGFGRRARVLLTRVRTDTALTPARIASWSQGKRSGTCSKCNMGVKADIFHLVWECPEYKDIRARHRPTDIASMEGWTHPPGSESDRRRVLKGLLDFIYEAKLDIFI